jgi:hypothetical protein
MVIMGILLAESGRRGNERAKMTIKIGKFEGPDWLILTIFGAFMTFIGSA